MRGFRLMCDIAVFLTFTRLPIIVMLQDRHQSLWSGGKTRKKIYIYILYIFILLILTEANSAHQTTLKVRSALYDPQNIILGQRNTSRYEITQRRNRWNTESTRRENAKKKKKKKKNRGTITGDEEKTVMGTHMAVYQLEMVNGFQTIQSSNTTVTLQRGHVGLTANMCGRH